MKSSFSLCRSSVAHAVDVAIVVRVELAIPVDSSCHWIGDMTNGVTKQRNTRQRQPLNGVFGVVVCLVTHMHALFF